MRPRSSWWGAHKNLKRLYADRIGDEVTYKDFGRRFDLGSASMVAQLLNGDKPLSIDAAGKFAKAFRCNINDFCPEMDDYLRNDIMPFVGKALRRAAVVLAALLFQLFQPSDANAQATSHNYFYGRYLTVIHIVASRLAAVLRRLVLGHTLQIFRMT